MNKFSGIMTVIFGLSVILNAQSRVVPLLENMNNNEMQCFSIPLWGDKIPNSNDKKVEEVYKDDHWNVVTKPDIAVFLPSKYIRTGKAVLVIPGGGYHAISYTWEGTDVAKWLNSNGITAFVLKYRLPTTKNNIVGYKSPLLDAARAMRLIRANADKWDIDKNSIGVMGFSAGGHLAATLGTRYETDGNAHIDAIDTLSARPDFMVLLYPVITMDGFTHGGSRKNLIGENPSKELVEYYSNEKHVTKNTPPTFLAAASGDYSVPVKNSLSFYEALQKNDKKAEIHIYQGGGHGFSLANTNGVIASWKNSCLEWLNSIK
jgi:acetyl esterase/lipase